MKEDARLHKLGLLSGFLAPGSLAGAKRLEAKLVELRNYFEFFEISGKLEIRWERRISRSSRFTSRVFRARNFGIRFSGSEFDFRKNFSIFEKSDTRDFDFAKIAKTRCVECATAERAGGPNRARTHGTKGQTAAWFRACARHAETARGSRPRFARVSAT